MKSTLIRKGISFIAVAIRTIASVTHPLLILSQESFNSNKILSP